MGNVLKADSASGLPRPDVRAPGEVRDLGVQVRQALAASRFRSGQARVLGRREAWLLGAFALVLHAGVLYWVSSKPTPPLPEVPPQVPPMTIEFTTPAPPVVEPQPPEPPP
ncbi:energy transducer TonB, partial [Pseudomonas otitidis]|nr:energy transducer TonB [Pseudomonas otitidis]